MLDKTYGKMPEEWSEKQIFMEFEYYLDLLADSTTFNETLVDAETV